MLPLPLVCDWRTKWSLRKIFMRGRLGPPRLVPSRILSTSKGFPLVKIVPREPTAAQKSTFGHETPKRALNGDGPVLTSRQFGALAFASGLERTLARALPARQRLSAWQSTAPRSPGPPGAPISVQIGAALAGFEETTILPLLATAMQKAGLGPGDRL